MLCIFGITTYTLLLALIMSSLCIKSILGQFIIVLAGCPLMLGYLPWILAITILRGRNSGRQCSSKMNDLSEGCKYMESVGIMMLVEVCCLWCLCPIISCLKVCFASHIDNAHLEARSQYMVVEG